MALALTAEDFVRRYISPFIKGAEAEALIGTLSDEVQKGLELSVSVSDQLSICTSSGIYLDKQTARVGLQRPAEAGIGDEPYRDLAISITATKLVSSVIQQVLEIFYGSDATRGLTVSGRHEPYALADGMRLTLVLEDNEETDVFFHAEDFANIAQATSAEVCNILIRELRQAGFPNALAVPYQDLNTGFTYVKVYGSARGPFSAISVAGGEVQAALEFPTMRDTNLSLNNTVWEVTKNVGQTFRFRWNGNTQPNLQNVQVGDQVLIYGSQFVAHDLGGTYTVTAVSLPGVTPNYTQGYFELTNDHNIQLKSSAAGVAPPPNVVGSTYSYGISQVNYDDLKFFKRETDVPNDNVRYAVAYEPADDTLKVYLLATTQIVQRDLVGGYYVHAHYPATDLSGVFGHSATPPTVVEIVNDRVVRWKSDLLDNYAQGGTFSYNIVPVTKVIDYTYRYGGYQYVRTTTPHGMIGDNQWLMTTNYVAGNTVVWNGFLYVALKASGPSTVGALDPSVYSAYWRNAGPSFNYSSAFFVTVAAGNVPADDPNKPYTSGYMADLEAPYNLTGYQLVSRTNIPPGSNTGIIAVSGTLPQQSGYLLMDLSQDAQEEPIPFIATQIQGPPGAVAISMTSQSNTNIVVTTASPHGQIPGENVTIAGTGLTDGTYTIVAVPTPSTYELSSPFNLFFTSTGGTSTPVSPPIVSLITVEPSYIFKKGHKIGANVTILSDNSAMVPLPNGADFPTYVTSTAETRVFAQSTVEAITALGIKNFKIVVVYPSKEGFGNSEDGTDPSFPPVSDVTRIWGVG